MKTLVLLALLMLAGCTHKSLTRIAKDGSHWKVDTWSLLTESKADNINFEYDPNDGKMKASVKGYVSDSIRFYELGVVAGKAAK